MEYCVKVFSEQHHFCVHGVSYIGQPKDNTAMFVTSKIAYMIEKLTMAKECLVFAEFGMEITPTLLERHCFVFLENPQSAYTTLAQRFAQERMENDRQRHYTLTDGGYYVGENVTLGADTVIEPLCLIGHDVVIGPHAYIMTGSKIRHSNIGSNFIAGENSVIGTDGFTLVDDADGNKSRLPTLGGVCIGDYVEIGALSSIEAGSAGDTTLDDYAKIDTCVFVGHDSHIGKNAEIVGGSGLGGFVTVEEKAFLGLSCIVKNRKNIGSGATVGMGAVVTKNVAAGITVIGNPAKPIEKER